MNISGIYESYKLLSIAEIGIVNELLRGKPRSIRSSRTTSFVLGEVVYIHLLFPAPEYMF